MRDHAEIHVETEGRLTAVEERLDVEAGLRASQDRDLATLKVEMRSANRLLQALAVSQSEQTRTLNRHGELLAQHNERLGRVEGRLDRVEGRLGRVEGRLGRVEESLGVIQSGVVQIVEMLDHLVERGDRPDDG